MDLRSFPFLYGTLNRNAIIVRPKKPFYNWLNSVYPNHKRFLQNEENNIYLIREVESLALMLKWVKKNFDEIFVNELNDWSNDEDKWPQNRNYKMFSEWFDVELSSMLIDLEDYPITKH
jgi:CRISPR/Cas system-associated protein Cas10 (large subunit of type III CRISPR-Cas system)